MPAISADFNISVVIPSIGSNTLATCIESLESQSLDSKLFEVIVVFDDPAIPLRLNRDVKINLKLLHSTGKGPAAARNVGIEAASSRYIFFTDDDCILDRNCLEEALKSFKENPDASIIEGKTVIDHNIDNFFTAGIFLPKEKYNFPTCNLSVSKDALLEVGLFDTLFKVPFREDSDLIFRLINCGFKYVHNENMVVFHPTKFIGFFESLRRCKYWFYEPLVFKKHPKMAYRHSNASKIGFLTASNKRFHMLVFGIALSIYFELLGALLVFYFTNKAIKTIEISKQLKGIKKISARDYFLFFIFSDLSLMLKQYYLIAGSLKCKRLVL